MEFAGAMDELRAAEVEWRPWRIWAADHGQHQSRYCKAWELNGGLTRAKLRTGEEGEEKEVVEQLGRTPKVGPCLTHCIRVCPIVK